MFLAASCYWIPPKVKSNKKKRSATIAIWNLMYSIGLPTKCEWKGTNKMQSTQEKTSQLTRRSHRSCHPDRPAWLPFRPQLPFSRTWNPKLVSSIGQSRPPLNDVRNCMVISDSTYRLRVEFAEQQNVFDRFEEQGTLFVVLWMDNEFRWRISIIRRINRRIEHRLAPIWSHWGSCVREKTRNAIIKDFIL